LTFSSRKLASWIDFGDGDSLEQQPEHLVVADQRVDAQALRGQVLGQRAHEEAVARVGQHARVHAQQQRRAVAAQPPTVVGPHAALGGQSREQPGVGAHAQHVLGVLGRDHEHRIPTDERRLVVAEQLAVRRG
jgi:hypothetical protein